MTKPVSTLKVNRASVNDQKAEDCFFKKNEIDKAASELEKIKDTKNPDQPKFSTSEVLALKLAMKISPEKSSDISILANNQNVSCKEILKLTRKCDAEKLGVIREFSQEQNRESKPKYTGQELINFATDLETEELKKVKPLTKTCLPAENVKLIAKKVSAKFIENAASEILDLEKITKEKDLNDIKIIKNNYDKDAFDITAIGTPTRRIVLDKDGEKESISESCFKLSYSNKDGLKTYYINKTNDLKNHTISKVRSIVGGESGLATTHEVRIVKDKNGKVLKTEYTSPSEIPGVSDVTVKYPDGKVEILSSGKYNPKTGITTVKKDMTSSNGTRTEYLYEDDENGNRIFEYKITDKNGKVLLNKNSTFEVINENKIISSKNNEKFEILIDDKKINVKDMNNPKRKASINLDKTIKGDKAKILKVLKELPGEELIKFAQSVKEVESIDGALGSKFLPGYKKIYTADHLFSFLHELGHARDHRDGTADSLLKEIFCKSNTIRKNEDLKKIYENERKAFIEAFPSGQREHVDYFTNINTHYLGKNGGLNETIAESNGLLTTPKVQASLMFRAQYLQQHFPETIAKAAELMEQEKQN